MTDSPASREHNSPQNGYGSPGYRGSARSNPRSKSGCYTCRQKKVKCDETRPQCLRCVRLSRECDYEPRERKKHTSRRVKKADAESLPVAPDSTETNHQTERHESSALAPVVLKAVQTLQVTKSSKRPSKQSIPLSCLPPPQISAACSLILSPEDHGAIHHFRTTFSTTHHTKNPQFSVLSIIFHLAAESPMLMHMVVALAGREATYFKFGDDANGTELESSITHYTLAMQAMVKAVDGTDPPDLGIVLAALWLMIIYEQKYGDSDGLSNHLKGAASILRQRCRPLVDGSYTSTELSLLSENEDNNERSKIAAMFAARMLVWLSAVDAGAATYGIGGHINSSIVELIARCAQSNNASPLNGFSVLHRHSRPLFRTMWGEAYPQSELLDDLQNNEVYSLLRECFQLRFMVARLASLSHEDPAVVEARSKSVDQTLQQVGEKYLELLVSSELLRFEDNSSQRLVSNILSIVPHYHAATLEFFRVVRPGKPLNERQRSALRSIISMAFRGYKHDGDRAMLRIPWPLFVAAIETDDPVHREWIFNRFQNIGRYGRNYRKALKVLEAVVKEQEKSGDTVNVLQLLESGSYDRFVI